MNARRSSLTRRRLTHAYLHRVEGDLSNAGGWYRRAGRPLSTAPLQRNGETISRALLG
jgi:hypothetical protein